MTAEHIRIVVVDDHYVVREGLRSLIERQSGFVLVGQASNGAEAIAVHSELQPDLMIMDLGLPGMGGIEATRSICETNPDARILVLSNFEGEEDIRAAFHAGALGYVLKHKSGEQLIAAIRAVLSGERWIPEEISQGMATHRLTETLTQREREIVIRVAKGEANKQIGETLGITEGTVKTHLKNVMLKLQANDRTEAVTIALRRGIIHLSEI